MGSILVRVKPRSSRSGLIGLREGVPVIGVHAAAEDGKANDELIRLLADLLDVTRQDIQILTGEKSRNKVIRVDRKTDLDLRSCLQEEWDKSHPSSYQAPKDLRNPG